MRLLSISDPQIWLLAGISILVVFAILIILVLILGIFSSVAKSTSAKANVAKTSALKGMQANAQGKAGEADKAAVAMALHLYFQERDNSESHVLTIAPYQTAWGAQLNPRL